MTSDGEFWGALARRKVLRTLGFYLAGAWLVLQVAEFFAELWAWPNWVLQATFILLVLGLPIVAVFSWVYDVSTAGLVESRGKGFAQLVSAAGASTRVGIALALILFFGILSFGLLHLWPDEDLNPRIRHLLANSGFSRNSPELAYRLYGFTAPPGQDPAVAGRFIVDTYNTLGSLPELEQPLRFSLTDRCTLSRGCSPQQVLADLESVPRVKEANAELMTRYHKLHESPVFSEVIRPSAHSPIVRMEEFTIAQYLTLREVAYLALRGGEPEQAWSMLARETTFHRELLANADHLLMKMVALTRVEEDIRFRVLLLAHGADPSAAGPMPGRLSLPERSIVPSIRFEILAALNTAFEINDRSEEAALSFESPGQRALFLILPYRRNATLNAWILPILAIAEASLLETRELQEWARSWSPPKPSVLQYFNNGAGMMVYGDGPPDFWFEYLFRVRDLDRIIILARLAERMLKEGVTAEGANGWLQALPAEFRDPYTGERPAWDADLLRYPELPDRATFNDPALDLPLPRASTADRDAG